MAHGAKTMMISNSSPTVADAMSEMFLLSKDPRQGTGVFDDDVVLIESTEEIPTDEPLTTTTRRFASQAALLRFDENDTAVASSRRFMAEQSHDSPACGGNVASFSRAMLGNEGDVSPSHNGGTSSSSSDDDDDHAGIVTPTPSLSTEGGRIIPAPVMKTATVTTTVHRPLLRLDSAFVTPDGCFVGGIASHAESPCADVPLLGISPNAKAKATRRTSGLVVQRMPSLTFAAVAADFQGMVDKGLVSLRLADEGASGTYFVVPAATPDAAPLAVFKPGDEEVGLDSNPRGNESIEEDERYAIGAFQAGELYRREALAYELDHGHFAGVPHTVLTSLDGSEGSLQKFMPKMMQSWSTTPGKFDTRAIQAIAVFDIRTLNCDRHGGNLLVRKDAPSLAMVPIDHGMILPETYCDPDFEWALWKQSAAPVDEGVRAYVAGLDADADAALVRERVGEGAAEIIAATTRLLQIVLADGKSYTLRDVAAFCRRATLTQPSGLESTLTKARRDLDDGGDVDAVAVELLLREAFP